MNFKDKKVLITGASRGIGKSTAIAFAKKGAQVGINYVKDDIAAKSTLSILDGEDHSLFKKDISLKESPKQLIEEFIKTYGKLDILVNNAGISEFHEIDKVEYNDWVKAWDNIINTNLTSIAHTCYWASKYMIENGGGRIINVSSRGAFRGEPTQSAYGASKAGLNSFSQSMAKALAKYKIYVGVVAPGFTETDMGMSTLTDIEKANLISESPFKRMAKPEEVAHSIMFLASEGAEFTSGTIIDVNGASYLRS